MTAERAGEGNMNCVVRVRFPNRSLILKQARPWVEKYPSIAAPVERAASEARFYHFAAKSSSVAAMMPHLLDFDECSALLIMEDISPADTLLDCYQGARSFHRPQLNELARYTSALHRLTIPPGERTAFRNGEMRKLNHEHIFDIPLRTDGALSEMLERITPVWIVSAMVCVGTEDSAKPSRSLDAAILSTRDRASFTATCFPGVCFRRVPGSCESSTLSFPFVGTRSSTSASSMRTCWFPVTRTIPQTSGCRWHWKTLRTPSLSSFNSQAWKSCAAFSRSPNCLLLSRWKPSSICSNEAAKWFFARCRGPCAKGLLSTASSRLSKRSASIASLKPGKSLSSL